MKTGVYLGELTNELESYGPNAYISEFASCGPKSYGYRITSTMDGADVDVCKVKGITLNTKNSAIINFDALRKQVLHHAVGENPPQLSVENTHFVRDKDFTVRTIKRKKDFNIVINKRRIIGLKTYPYGYIFDV